MRSQSPAKVSTAEHPACFLQVFRRIDAVRHAFHQRDIDPHAVVERAQLLEPLALLVGRRWQFDEALQRRAAICIKADVMVMRTGPDGIGARERRRMQAAGRS